jgi:hypothetical protein
MRSSSTNVPGPQLHVVQEVTGVSYDFEYFRAKQECEPAIAAPARRDQAAACISLVIVQSICDQTSGKLRFTSSSPIEEYHIVD